MPVFAKWTERSWCVGTGMLIERFLSWMMAAEEAQRCDAAGLLARLHGDVRLTELDREAVEAGLTLLLDDGSPRVRAALARVVVAENCLPHHLALALGHDDDDIAGIIVAGSTQLLEGELVDLVAGRGATVQTAAAARRAVSPGLAAALAEVGAAEALVELLLNPDARLAEFSLLRILERHGDDPIVRRAMANRADMTVCVRQYLVRLEAADLFGVTLAAANRGDAPVEIAARETAEKETIELAAEATDTDIIALIDYLKDTAQLTTALILRAAVAGDMRFTGQALARLTDLAPDRVFFSLERGEEAAVRALALKAGLPARAVPALYAAVEVARERAAAPFADQSYGHVRRTVERIVARYCDARGDELDDLMATLRRYASDAARDAARRYATANLSTRTLALPMSELLEKHLPPPVDAASATDDDGAGHGFGGLGTAFDEADWMPIQDSQETVEARARPDGQAPPLSAAA